MPGNWWPEARSGELVAYLDDAELARLTALMGEWSVKAGEIVLHRGDPAANLVLVEAGEVEVVDTGLGIVLARIGPGGVVGEVGFVDGLPRTHDVRACSDSRLRHLSRESLLGLVDSAPLLFAKVTVALAELVAQRFRSALADLEPIRAFAADLEEPVGPEPEVASIDELEAIEDLGSDEANALDLIRDLARKTARDRAGL
jgi:CRP-like cAMP-binding protein